MVVCLSGLLLGVPALQVGGPALPGFRVEDAHLRHPLPGGEPLLHHGVHPDVVGHARPAPLLHHPPLHGQAPAGHHQIRPAPVRQVPVQVDHELARLQGHAMDPHHEGTQVDLPGLRPGRPVGQAGLGHLVGPPGQRPYRLGLSAVHLQHRAPGKGDLPHGGLRLCSLPLGLGHAASSPDIYELNRPAARGPAPSSFSCSAPGRRRQLP